MKKLVFILLVGWGMSAGAVTKEVLPDYVGTFKKMDAQIRAISEADATCTNYTKWIFKAIDCKHQLRLENLIDPWLKELSTLSSNNWKIGHAVAVGYANNFYRNRKTNKRWLIVNLMDRAYRRAIEKKASDQELVNFIRDYIKILLIDRDFDNAYLLRLKSSDPTEKDSFTPNIFDGKKVGDLVFFDCPASYDSAKNDGELLRWLIEKSMPASYNKALFLSDFGMASFAWFLTGQDSYSVNRMDEAEKKKLHALAENEVFIEQDDDTYRVYTLPKDYCYIARYKKLAAEGNREALRMLGIIFHKRKQLEKAAHFYELAGETNLVRSIRAPQGELDSCRAQISGKPAHLDYSFRNGTNVLVEVFYIQTGEDYFDQLKKGSLSDEMLRLVTGDPYVFTKDVTEEIRRRRPYYFEKDVDFSKIPSKKVASFSVPLSPKADHGDSKKRIQFPLLKKGHYWVRVTMDGGNSSEMFLHLFDTVVVSGNLEMKEGKSSDYPSQNFFLLCDAQTGTPLPEKKVYIFEYEKEKNKPAVFSIQKRLVSDERGFVSFSKIDVSSVNHANYLLVGNVTTNLDLLALPYNWDDFSTYYPKDLMLWSVTDRPVYRPGETGSFKFYLWGTPPEEEYQMQIYNSAYRNTLLPFIVDGVETNTLITKSDRFLGLSGTFKIPKDAHLGKYCFLQMHDGVENDFWFPICVEEYRVPPFVLNAQMISKDQIEISANYAYGEPIPSAKATIRLNCFSSKKRKWYPSKPFDFLLHRGYWWNGDQFKNLHHTELNYEEKIFYTNVVLNASGHFTMDLKKILPKKQPHAIWNYILDFSVTDSSNKKESETFYFGSDSPEDKLCCWADKAFYKSNETVHVFVAQKKKEKQINFKLSRIEGSNRVVVAEKKGVNQSALFSSLSAGIYEICAQAKAIKSKPFHFCVLGGKPEQLDEKHPIQIVYEKGLYKKGEKVKLLLQIDQPEGYVYLFSHKNVRSIFSQPKLIQIHDYEKMVELKADDVAGTHAYTAVVIRNGVSYSSPCNIPVVDESIPIGNITIQTDKKFYTPKERVIVKLQALDQNKKGVPCSITVTVYNQMLDQFEEEYMTDIREILFQNWRTVYGDDVILYSNVFDSFFDSQTPKWVMKETPLQSYMYVFNNQFAISFLVGSAECFGRKSENSPEEIHDESPSSAQEKVQIRKDFRNSAYWNATIETDEQGRATIEFPMPDQFTKWKIQAWGIHTNYAASGTASVVCKKDFVTQLNLPRFMVEGDELDVSADVRNYTTNDLSVVTHFSLEGDALELKSPETIKINPLKKKGSKMLFWKLEAKKAGVEKITFTAQGKYNSDGEEKQLSIHAHTMLKRDGNGGVLAGDQKEEIIEINFPKVMDSKRVELNLNCSANMQDVLVNALPYLAEYPHGCTEQTLNRFLPALVVLQMLDQLKEKLKPSAIQLPNGRKAVLNRKQIENMAQKGIDMLEDAKLSDGWNWNLGGFDEDLLTTLWVLRGMHLASQNTALKVSEEKIVHALRYLFREIKYLPTDDPKKKVRNSDAFVTVVCMELMLKRYVDKINDYSLEEMQKVLFKSSSYLLKNAEDLSLYGKMLLAYSFELQGKTKQRNQLLQFIEQYVENDSARGIYSIRTQDKQWWCWYNDSIELHAWYLKLLNRIEPRSKKTAGVARYLLQNRIYGDHWKATRDTAVCIEALAEYMVNNPLTPKKETVQISLNNTSIPFASSGHYHFTNLKPGINKLKIKSNQSLFFDATWKYNTHEKKIAAESCELITLSRTYHRINQKDKAVKTSIAPNEKIKIGETIEVHLTLNSAQDLEYLLLEDFKPAGFESIGVSHHNNLGFVELHDERISCYIKSIHKGIKEMSYRIRAEHTGKMAALPATVELMYAPQQAANSAEDKLEVQK